MSTETLKLPLMPEGKELLAPFAGIRRAHERIAQRESFKATLPPLTPPGK